MATNAAAYKELTPFTNPLIAVGQSNADRTEASNRQKRQFAEDEKQRQYAAEEKDKERQEERRKEGHRESVVPVDDFKTSITGFKDRDTRMQRLSQRGLERAQQYSREAREAGLRGDWKEQDRLIGKMNAIGLGFKNIASDETRLGELFKSYKDAYIKGEYDDDEWTALTEAVETNSFDIIYDENDNPVIRALMEDEDTGEEYVKDVSVSDIKNGIYTPIKTVKIRGEGGIVDDMLIGFGKRVYDETGENYVTTNQVWDQANEDAFDRYVTSLDDKEMYSLLKQFSDNEIKKKSGFTESDKQLVRDSLYDLVRGQYSESRTERPRQRTPEEIRQNEEANRALTRRGQDQTQARHDDNLKLAYERLKADKEKGPTTEKGQKMSLLRQDSIDFAEGKTQVANGTKITKGGREYTVYDTLQPEGADYVVVYMKDDKGKVVREEVPKTERGFVDFKLQSPEYSKYDPEAVLLSTPKPYQELTAKEASEIQAVFDNKYKNSSGKFNGDRAGLMEDLKTIYGLSEEELEVISKSFELKGGHIKINGTEVNLEEPGAISKIDKLLVSPEGKKVGTTTQPIKSASQFNK